MSKHTEEIDKDYNILCSWKNIWRIPYADRKVRKCKLSSIQSQVRHFNNISCENISTIKKNDVNTLSQVPTCSSLFHFLRFTILGVTVLSITSIKNVVLSLTSGQTWYSYQTLWRCPLDLESLLKVATEPIEES